MAKKNIRVVLVKTIMLLENADKLGLDEHTKFRIAITILLALNAYANRDVDVCYTKYGHMCKMWRKIKEIWRSKKGRIYEEDKGAKRAIIVARYPKLETDAVALIKNTTQKI